MSLVPVDEAIRRIVAGVERVGGETVALAEATGCVLAEPLVAKRTQPPFPASAMDGYAVRAGDAAHAGVRLKVIGIAAAGHGFSGSVGPGETVRIFTGAPVPEGADTVLIQEDAEAIDPRTILVREGVAPGRNVRVAGLDFRQGDALVPAGRKVGMAEAALAAAMGYAAVPVLRRPRVAIIATGDELVSPAETPGPDQIVSSNAFGVAALCRAIGAMPLDLGIVPDQRSAIGIAVKESLALRADIIVTLGGASVGDHDLVRQSLEANGMTLDFWQIAMRPGKPLMFGRLGDVRVLGLPGNPVSSLVCALLFLRPLVGALLGRPATDPTEPAMAGANLAANDHRQDYLRATFTQAEGALPVVVPAKRQDSSMLATLAAANCLLVRAPNAPAARAGQPCRIIRLPEG